MNISNKYLPIGTICNIKSNNKPVMIIGYFSVEYSGNIKMYDYKGCDYPEGLLLENKVVSFNKNDITEVLYNGYINEDFNKFNTIITEQKNNTNVKENDKQIFSNIKFDENGVVVYTELNKEVEQSEPVKFDNSSKREFVNPFYRQYSSDVDNNNQNSSEWPIFKNIVFDENGTVVQLEEYTEEEKNNSSNEG